MKKFREEVIYWIVFCKSRWWRHFSGDDVIATNQYLWDYSKLDLESSEEISPSQIINCFLKIADYPRHDLNVQMIFQHLKHRVDDVINNQSVAATSNKLDSTGNGSYKNFL